MKPDTMTLVRSDAPRWLILLTVGLTLLILVMAVAETTLWTHYLIDEGEFLSLFGLVFAMVVGLYLHRSGRLVASLPLMLPWLIYPVLTQGDQIIDNLTINQMRAVCQLILAVLFGAPIVVLVLAARHFLAPAPGRSSPGGASWTFLFPGLRLIAQGRIRQGACLMSLALLLLEVWVAYEFLGKLMVLTLIAMGMIVLFFAAWSEGKSTDTSRAPRVVLGRRLALGLFIAGVAASFALYAGFKNRPGSYQGSPHHYHDPTQRDAAYPVDRIPVPSGNAAAPAAGDSGAVEEILRDYGEILEDLLHAYYILDRNYNYAFHNALFLRQTPVLADFRDTALAKIARARDRAAMVDARLRSLESSLPRDGGLVALLQEVRGFVAFNLHRAAILEEMSGRFEQTEAGLQHATHLYEGEGKEVGKLLMEILQKYRTVLDIPDIASLAAPFVRTSREIHEAYANRIVGF